MSILIKNGEIITPNERYIADIFCEDETITQIDREITPPNDSEVIDATGKYVFPGFIDPHVHIYLPFMGTLAKDTHETASRAALVGGTTTFIEMICPGCEERRSQAFELWLGKAQGASACDFTLSHGRDPLRRGGGARFSRNRQARGQQFQGFPGLQRRARSERRTSSTKRSLLPRSLGVITTAHCENADLVAELQKKLLAEGKTGPEWHYWSRPPIVEAEGVHHLMTFAQITGAHVYIVHLSCGEALREAIRGAARGVNVWVETLIQYPAPRSDRRGETKLRRRQGGHVAAVARARRNQETLWNGLRRGFISTLATDHAPFDFATQKILGRDDFTKIPNGIPSLEDRINLYYTHGVEARPDRPPSVCRKPRARRPQKSSDSSRAKGPSSSAATPTWWFMIPITAGRFPPRPTR